MHQVDRSQRRTLQAERDRDDSRSGLACSFWVVAAIGREELVGLLHPDDERQG